VRFLRVASGLIIESVRWVPIKMLLQANAAAFGVEGRLQE